MGLDTLDPLPEPEMPVEDRAQPVANDEPLTESLDTSSAAEQSQPPDLPTLQGAPFGIRARAYLIDFIVMTVALLAGVFVAGGVLAVVLALAGRRIVPVPPNRLPWIDNVLLSLVHQLGYFPVFEWLYGATPGKLALGLRVVRENGERPGLWPALVRGVLRLVDGLFFGVPAARAMAASSTNQRLGDHYAHTLVVSHHDAGLGPQRSWGWFALASALSGLMMLALSTLIVFRQSAVSPGPTRVAASDLNLRLDDLGPGFTLERDAGKEGYTNAAVTDASLRVFTNGELWLHAQVVTFRVGPGDIVQELMATQEQDLRESSGVRDMFFDAIREVAVGENAGLRRFGAASTGLEGWILVSLRRNVVVHLLSYSGPESAITGDEMVRLAGVVDARIR